MIFSPATERRVRQVILDTETTGLSPSQGHRVIEIGCVEMVNRTLTGEVFQRFLNPEREVDAGALEVHGIRSESLVDQPRFADIADEFIEFIRGAELVIHNAPFDLGFLNAELSRLGGAYGSMQQYCEVLDTLVMAKRKHPGQRNSLDALCRRYDVDRTRRTLHGALLDAELLAAVYLAMSGGQSNLDFAWARAESTPGVLGAGEVSAHSLPVIKASPQELAAHQKVLEHIEQESENCLWLASPE